MGPQPPGHFWDSHILADWGFRGRLSSLQTRGIMTLAYFINSHRLQWKEPHTWWTGMKGTPILPIGGSPGSGTRTFMAYTFRFTIDVSNRFIMSLNNVALLAENVMRPYSTDMEPLQCHPYFAPLSNPSVSLYVYERKSRHFGWCTRPLSYKASGGPPEVLQRSSELGFILYLAPLLHGVVRFLYHVSPFDSNLKCNP